MNKRNHICLFHLLLISCLFLTHPAQTQMDERLYTSDYHLPADKQGELRIEVDNVTFFKDNEFTGPVMKGYSLPGLWIQPKLVFYPLSNIKIEAGAHALVYTGAYKFPNYAYEDIAVWKGSQYQKGAHVLPYFRAQVALNRVNLVLGNLYGGQNHGLSAPLYNPELNLTADAESGFQLLCDLPHWHFDAWINWQSFIFDIDTHQEAFMVGVNSTVKLNAPDAPLHFFLPIQGIVQHRGGEQVETEEVHPVHTIANGSVGLGATWNARHKVLRNFTAEAHLLGYYQQAGKVWPFNDGTALYAQATADLWKGIRLQAGYFRAHRFISIAGLPYFGAVSMKHEEAVFPDYPQTCTAGIEYSRVFAEHYVLGAQGSLYYSMPGRMRLAGGETQASGHTANFSFGIYFRINPSFLLKRF